MNHQHALRQVGHFMVGLRRRLPHFLVAAALTITFAVNLSAEEEPGLELLDSATETKLSAQRLSDLQKVIDYCRRAIEKGLNEDNEDYARQLMTSCMYERAERLVEPIFMGQLDLSWTRRRDEALRSLEEAIEVDPDHGEALLLLARVHSLPGGDVAVGRSAADKALELLTDNPPRRAAVLLARAQLTLDNEARLADLDKALEANPRDLDVWRERGRSRLVAGDSAGAIEDFLYLLEKDEDDLETLEEMARALATQEKYEEAIEHVSRAIELNPKSPVAYTLRSGIYILQDKSDEAIADLNEALRLEPRDVGALLTRGRLREMREEYEQARADVDRALELRPGSSEALLLRSQILSSAGRFGDAISDLQRLLDRNPDNLILQLQMAAVYLADKRPRKAIEAYSRVAEDPDSRAFALRGRGDALLAIGDHAGAIADYEEALKIEALDSAILNNLAWVLATSPDDDVRDGERAIELATQACEETNWGAAHILSTLAAGYAENGDFDEAIKWSTKAVELGEGDVKEQLAQELVSYREKKPWRERQETEENSTSEPNPSDLQLDAPDEMSSSDSSELTEAVSEGNSPLPDAAETAAETAAENTAENTDENTDKTDDEVNDQREVSEQEEAGVDG